MEEQPVKETPAWLKHLQENSWEAEILISGGAIFTLFQLADGLIHAADFFKEVSSFVGLNILTLVLMIILRGVTIGFIIHLLLRGTWIALVCLNSIYPNGINYQKLKIANPYLDQAKKTTLTDQIIRLDILSGLVFFGSFLFIIILAGVTIIISLVSFPTSFFFASTPWYDWIFYLFYFLAAIYFLDLITSGMLRRGNWVGKLYHPLFATFNALTLGSFYRLSLQVISTNVNRYRAGLFLILLLGSSVFFAFLSLQRTLNINNFFDRRDYWGPAEGYAIDDFYDDRISDEAFVWRASIQSDFIKNDYLRVFIPYKARYNYQIEKGNKKTFGEIVGLAINDSTYQHIQWSRYGRPRSGQRGIISYFPIAHLSKGKNELTIRIAGETFFKERDDKLVIPFWKE